MYVNPFWFGVLVTVTVELVTIVAAAVAISRGNKE